MLTLVSWVGIDIFTYIYCIRIYKIHKMIDNVFTYIYTYHVMLYVATFQTIFLFMFPSGASYLYIGAVYFSFLLEQTSSNKCWSQFQRYKSNMPQIPSGYLFHMVHIRIFSMDFPCDKLLGSQKCSSRGPIYSISQTPATWKPAPRWSLWSDLGWMEMGRYNWKVRIKQDGS